MTANHLTICCALLCFALLPGLQVYAGGLATDYCVGFTCKDAMRLGFSTTMVLDACRGIAADTTDAMLRELEDEGACLVDGVQDVVKAIAASSAKK